MGNKTKSSYPEKKPIEGICCRDCKRRYKIEPDETPDDCGKRFGLKRINKNGDTFDENGIYVCGDCFIK
ncbi:MAG: hypothetical protein KAT28_03390 [Candidatus Aenigmarchaeota archaeon]|nr:hypothetical protein [Candidatus Aenigmarchaeota archaeon]